MTASQFNPDTFFKDQVNRHCRLPAIDRNDAFDLWYTAINLVSAARSLERLASRYMGPLNSSG